MASEWISVKERLPEPGISVLTFNGFVAVNSIDQEENPPDWGGGWDDRPRPTHWMPIPPLPAPKLTVKEALREAIVALEAVSDTKRRWQYHGYHPGFLGEISALGLIDLLPRLRAALEGEE